MLEEEEAEERALLDTQRSVEDVIRDREENSEQIKALDELKQMAASYGHDISGPAGTGREAAFGRLAAAKTGTSKAMRASSMKRVSVSMRARSSACARLPAKVSGA